MDVIGPIFRAHCVLFAIVAFVASAALVAASSFYDEPARILIATSFGTLLLAGPCCLLGYPIYLRRQMKESGYAPSRGQIAILLLTFIISFGFFALIIAGTSQEVTPGGFSLIIFLSWLGSLVFQAIMAGVLQWEPIDKSPAYSKRSSFKHPHQRAPALSRSQRRENERQKRREHSRSKK